MKPSKSKFKISHVIPIVFIAFLGFLFLNSTSLQNEEKSDALYELNSHDAPMITVSSNVPKDIFTDGTRAKEANLSQAANFAWNEFIALNWPAKKGNRDVPDTSLKFGSQDGKTPLVWHTYRHKVETYPGNGKPPPGYNASAPDFGYNTSSPSYLYDPSKTGTGDGSVNPCTGTASTSTPWINLDEKNEIGVTTMYAGVSNGAGFPDPQILFLAKSNVEEYKYSANNKWWAGENGFRAARKSTRKYITDNGMTPPYSATSKKYVSLPPGTIEVKTAWRRLTNEEKASNRFYSTTVRYYNEKDGYPCYTDDEFGMIALHIIHKTPTAPYFIYATFEHGDNILTTDGKPVEDVNGNIIANQHLAPTTPALKVTNATHNMPEMFSPTSALSTPEKSLYYINVAGKGTPTGKITYNRRYNNIPSEVISANKNAHMLINKYNTQNGIENSPWEFYKLINVQYAPLDKDPGIDYTGPRRSEYYLSNSVVESDYVLQMFSGAFDEPNFTTTDFAGKNKVLNAYDDKGYLMGGCMGCHGNATNKGRDYSFILGKPVPEPEIASPVDLTESRVKSLSKILHE